MVAWILLFALLIWAALPVVLKPTTGSTFSILYNDNVLEIDGTDGKLDLKKDAKYTLDADEYDYLLGDMVIEVKSGKVRIEKERSPQNICSNMGWISKTSEALICVPNRIIIKINGANNDDQAIDK